MKKLFLILSLLSFGIANATNYYVSTTGNNGSNGLTTGTAWATIAYALANTSSGDVIFIMAGTHTVSAQLSVPVGVSIEGVDSVTSIINSTSTGTYGTLFQLESADNTDGNQHISNLTMEGGYVNASTHKTWVAIWVTGRSNVLIYSCRIKNFYWRGVIYNGTGWDPANNQGTDIGQNKARGNQFYNNTMTNCADFGISGGGSGAFNFGFQDSMLIHHNTIQQNERAKGLNGWPIKFWNDGWNEDCKMYNNTLIKIPYDGDYPGDGSWDFNVELFNCSGLEIYNNIFRNGAVDLNYNYAYSANKTFAYSVWIHDNQFYNDSPPAKVEGSIIFEYRTENAIVENNVFYNKTYGITYNTRGYGEDGDDNLPLVPDPPAGGYSYIVNNVIKNNLFYNMSQTTGGGIGNRFVIGIISESTDDPVVRNLKIINNTFVAYASDPMNYAIEFTSQNAGDMNEVYIQNNIIQGFANGFFAGDATDTNIDSMWITYNQLRNNGNSNNPYFPAGNPTNYTINNNLTTDPLFVGGTDYTLQAGSPCIDSGVDVGLPYNDAAPDRGYWESGSAAPPTNPGLKLHKKIKFN